MTGPGLCGSSGSRQTTARLRSAAVANTGGLMERAGAGERAARERRSTRFSQAECARPLACLRIATLTDRHGISRASEKACRKAQSDTPPHSDSSTLLSPTWRSVSAILTSTSTSSTFHGSQARSSAHRLVVRTALGSRARCADAMSSSSSSSLPSSPSPSSSTPCTRAIGTWRGPAWNGSRRGGRASRT